MRYECDTNALLRYECDTNAIRVHTNAIRMLILRYECDTNAIRMLILRYECDTNANPNNNALLMIYDSLPMLVKFNVI